MFDVDEYLQMYNGAFDKRLKVEDIDKSKPILSQLGDFNHYRPANYFAKEISEIKLSDETLDRFEKLFDKINKLF